jgi:ABC-type dipeptide/oligopeptide/nickel transport system ATPase component
VDRGCVVLVVTHDLASIAAITTHVAVLKRGKLVHEERGDGFALESMQEIYDAHSV